MSKSICLVHGRKAARQHKKAKGKRKMCLQVWGPMPGTRLCGLDGWTTVESVWWRELPAPGEYSEAQAIGMLTGMRNNFQAAWGPQREFRIVEEELGMKGGE